MHDIGLWEAIRLWFSGERLDSYSMLSISFLVWGRIGKVASIIGGLVVILDFVGEQRLRDWGTTLQDQPLRRLFTRIGESWLAAGVVLLAITQIATVVDRYMGGPIRSLVEPVSGPISRNVAGWRAWAAVAIVVALALGASQAREQGWHRTGRMLTWSWRLSAGLVGLAFLVEAIDGILGLVAILLIWGVAIWLLARLVDATIYALNPLVIKPIAWSLARESPGQPIRWAGFLMLLVGQMLDLLAS
jgi:hypothetical protein